MRRYPSIDTDPGLESWISEGMPEKATETEKKVPGWNREKVFHDLALFSFNNCSAAEAASSHAENVALHEWHKSHHTPSAITIGQPILMRTGQSI